MNLNDPYQFQEIFHNHDILTFTEQILGMKLHPGQKLWLKYAWKPINILKPANQWGKTTVEAIFHIYQAVCKPGLDQFNLNYEDWFAMRYPTLNFGKTYEIARGVMEHVIDITEGRFLLPDGTMNQSLLKGWAIKDIWRESPKLPAIFWWNNSQTLIRSYDGLGESFKRLRLAFVSGDECGDIPELRLFLNGTLLPRTFFFKAPIHLVGTSQPKGLEYEAISDDAEEDYLRNGLDAEHFVISYNVDPEMSAVFRNDFMNQDYLRKLESIADPELRKQIIRGMYVDWSEHLYTWDEINQMFTKTIPYDPVTGLSEAPIPEEFYVFSCDMAATHDETSITCIRYNIRRKLADGTFKHFAHKVVFHKAWKGETLPLSLQYEIIKQYFMQFKKVSPTRTKFVYDSGGLGGKNAQDAFKDLFGVSFPPKGRSYGDVKAEGMGKVKEVLGRGRDFIINEDGKVLDKNPNWGGLRASSGLTELRRQLEVSSKDDDKLKNDQYTSLMMALHYIESRAPKAGHSKAVDFNVMRSFNAYSR